MDHDSRPLRGFGVNARLLTVVDTVENAQNTPEVDQSWGDLGLTEDEYLRVREILGRRPTSGELAMYAVMWSEHCSYKSSKVHLRRFGELSQDTPRGPLLAGIGEQAGVVDIGNGWAVTFKIESHNSPSYIEPYQGAATGIGGVVRDILAMGARPIGVMDQLRFGPLDAPDTSRVMPGVVAGLSGYGNTLGVAGIGGETVFEKSYYGNPLVNAFCVGVLRHEDMQRAHASGIGNKVILYGAATGGDGIGGAVMSSGSFTEDGPQESPNVQAGDPFMEKLIIECTLELFAKGLINGIQDLGAAGISCATSELASAGDGGMYVTLDGVELRDEGLTPEEILMSESQERMMAVAKPEDVEEFLAVCSKWGVGATVIGEVVEGDRLIIDYQGQRIVDVDPRTVAHEGPVYNRPYHRPNWIDGLNADVAERLGRASNGDELAAQVLAVAGSPNMCDRSWITEQFDRYVRGNTVFSPPEDAGILRIDENTGLGIAVATDCNNRFAYLNPYLGAQLALSEAYRNVSVTGAEPVAITDGLNFGSPEDPDVMWQFVETILGLVDGCRELGTPVTGGNVSFYNQTGTTNIQPTPIIGMVGVLDDVATRTPSGFAHDGDAVVLLGDTGEDLSGSEWASVIHDHVGGMPPMPNLDAERRLSRVLVAASRTRLLSSAHDLSDGGLAQAVVESCLRNDMGAVIRLPHHDPTVALFSESVARALVSLPFDSVDELESLCAEHGVPCRRIGTVTANPQLVVEHQFSLPLADIRERWEAPIRKLMVGD